VKAARKGVKFNLCERREGNRKMFTKRAKRGLGEGKISGHCGGAKPGQKEIMGKGGRCGGSFATGGGRSWRGSSVEKREDQGPHGRPKIQEAQLAEAAPQNYFRGEEKKEKGGGGKSTENDPKGEPGCKRRIPAWRQRITKHKAEGLVRRGASREAGRNES